MMRTKLELGDLPSWETQNKVHEHLPSEIEVDFVDRLLNSIKSAQMLNAVKARLKTALIRGSILFS